MMKIIKMQTLVLPHSHVYRKICYKKKEQKGLNFYLRRRRFLNQIEGFFGKS